MYQYGTNIQNSAIQYFDQFMFQKTYVIEGTGALVNEKGEDAIEGI